MAIEELFDIRSGKFHAKKELDPGDVPLISCGGTDNGFIGFYDIPRENTHRNAITIAYNGQPLTAKYHPYRFGAKDDVAVLVPKQGMSCKALLLVAALLNRTQWRYSYGRKCFREKLKKVHVPLPVDAESGRLNEKFINALLPKPVGAFLPPQRRSAHRGAPPLKWQLVQITQVLDLARGDFHSLKTLAPGPWPTVSRVTHSNGVEGRYERPADARIYPPGVITVSTVSGAAFLQMDDFTATDNVVLCTPLAELSLTTLAFIAAAINHQSWRYSYGRQCYLTKLSQVHLWLPIGPDGKLDEASIAKIVNQATYWKSVERRLKKKTPPRVFRGHSPTLR